MAELTERQALIIYQALVYHDGSTLGGDHLSAAEKNELTDALDALRGQLRDKSARLRITRRPKPAGNTL